MPDLLPLFVKLTGRTVVLVGGGGVAAGKLQQLLAAGANIHVVAPEIVKGIEGHAGPRVELLRRDFAATDLDGAWLVVAAATPEVNRAVAAAAAERRIFVNAVDDPPNASAYLSGVVRRDGVTIAISTDGAAPALTALLREGVDALLPRDLSAWMDTAREQRAIWRRDAVPMDARKPRLLRALNALYDAATRPASPFDKLRVSEGREPLMVSEGREPLMVSEGREPLMVSEGRDPLMVSLSNHEHPSSVPWLHGPEDSWL